MDQWEYINILIKAEEGQWVVTFTGGARLVGLEGIWNYFGSIGWELASVTPTEYERADLQSRDYHFYEATAFLAVFKRRKARNNPLSLPYQGYPPEE